MPGTLYQNPTLFNESVSAVTLSNTVALGAIQWLGGNQYNYVYMDSSTPSAGQAGYAVNLLSGGSGYTVTMSMALGDYAYGVIQNATMATSYYGWVLVNGHNAMVQTPATTGVVGGCPLGVTASGTFGNLFTLASGGTAGAPVFCVGRALTTGATGTSVLANVSFLN